MAQTTAAYRSFKGELTFLSTMHWYFGFGAAHVSDAALSHPSETRSVNRVFVATGAGGHQNHRNHRRPHARRWCGARISTSAKCAWARKRDVGGVAADVRARVSPVRG